MFTHMPCAQALVVRVESDEAWYLNSKRIEPDDFAEALRAQMGASRNCIVFFDAEPDVDYAVAIHAIDLIEQSQGTVVLLTPETKPLRIP
jgi:biopolymer transport protein ExbD